MEQQERLIWIVDFGSQYTQLITRKSRELGYSSEIITLKESRKRIEAGQRPKAFVLSGGPMSVAEDKNDYDFLIGLDDIPTLGICYGMQLMARHYGGTVEKGIQGEYGHAKIHFEGDKFPGCPKEFNVWMSHFDHVTKVPDGFETVLTSNNNLLAGMKHSEKAMLALQFHPEVEHSEHGKDILRYYYEDMANLKKDWSAAAMLEEAKELAASVKEDYVLCAFSGGVDSLVAATLCHEVLGDKVHCFFVDNGLLRPQDYHHIELLKEKTPLNIEVIDAKELFLGKLKGEGEPEAKRKAIGTTFIEVFEQKVHEYEDSHNIKFKYLLQGTLYPDVIESLSPHDEDGKSSTIKSHHNVGGLPERMNLELLEPLRFLFKDEVRVMGEQLGLKHEWVHRHPFPGPGIGIRVLGEIDEASIKKVQESDQILFEELHNFKVYDAVWQAFTVLLPVNTVGVKGDARAYEQVICIRLVNSTDGMTAEWSDVPRDFLSKASSRITNEVAGITRVVYDITSKPPGTIEWE
ncbi:MAG: glutamine-hydrolyzing GMP synthase [Halobacteriovorax sp.]|nr:glutamine-hydrolyzing GMP synthase [Halobacteriovorax sp.]|tara:strand:+ start:125046 stop:126602 length:1557 start_codon:yes stop_codon:yes gene_type:complete